MPFHVHDVAYDVCTEGTSKRRYGQVRLVEVPETVRNSWLSANQKKATMNPFLANFQAMSHTGPVYATLCCSHFVEAQKLIAEGGRRYRDKPDEIRLQLRDDDEEGKLIQSQGVIATVYSETLWEDSAALLAIMREDNLDATIATVSYTHLTLPTKRIV